MDYLTVDELRKIADENNYDEDDLIFYLITKYNQAIDSLRLVLEKDVSKIKKVKEK